MEAEAETEFGQEVVGDAEIGGSAETWEILAPPFTIIGLIAIGMYFSLYMGSISVRSLKTILHGIFKYILIVLLRYIYCRMIYCIHFCSSKCIFILFSGLLILSCTSQRRWWKQLCRKIKPKGKVCTSNVSLAISESTPRAWSLKADTSFSSQASSDKCNPFFTSEELGIINDFKCFSNTPLALFKLAIPALLTLALCPATLYLYQPLVQMLWPLEEFPQPPKINDVIACFLTPAGLVYAIAFGFAFQEALSRQQRVSTQVS